eukprot:SAG31_NODE_2007_length_6678_cov_3.061864_5_plen_108_part_00
MFRNDLSGLTFFQREGGYERLSAYRFHTSDPLSFNGGGKLLWWVGKCKPFEHTDRSDAAAGITKCGNPVPPTPHSSDIVATDDGDLKRLGRALTPINVTTYGWYYEY